MGKTVLITAGGTSEPIDEVRKITNMSTGKLGYEICHQLITKRGQEIDKIYYLCSTHAVQPPDNTDKVELISIHGTYDVKKKVEEVLSNHKIDFFIHSMAVSDYTTDYVTNTVNLAKEITSKVLNGGLSLTHKQLENIIEDTIKNSNQVLDRSSKISSSEDNILIKLKSTPKIISIIKDIQPSTFLVGFKLLNNVSEEELFETAYNLLVKNKCDLVVANDLTSIRNGKHTAMIIRPNRTKEVCFEKKQIAEVLVENMWK
jgi:phosphopantothenate---cysteine ligase (CTP)